MYTAPLSDKAVDDIAESDGVLENLPALPALDVDLADTFIIQTLHRRIENSIDYWNDLKGFNLRDSRIRNLKAFKGAPVKQNQLQYEEDEWVDNEIFVGVDSIVAYTTAGTSRPEVYPSDDDVKSKTYATHLEKYMQAHSKKFHLDKMTEVSILNLLTQHVGVIKFQWNPNFGRNGEIIPRTINPSHIILDKNAKLGENPSFICEVMKDSLEGICSRFPDKEQEIMSVFGIKRKGAQNISKEIAYREVWFTYYDKDNKPQEAVCWYTGKLVLDIKKNPNWLYDGEEGANFLDNPVKPYIFFNLINDGEHMIDSTGPIAQAVPMQQTLNNEGQQISQNLITANGSRVIAASAMTTDQMELWDEVPNQTVAAELKPGQRLEDIVMQLPPHRVSAELINDKVDSRNTTHGILGTPSQFRGDNQNQADTASDNNQIKNQAAGRQDKIIRAIDVAMEDYFNLLAQFIVVYYTAKHCRTINGGDGNFDHIEMHRDKVDTGMTITVQAGSTLQFDKARQEAVAQNAAQLGFLAPYDYFVLMHMDQPQKLYDNLMKWKTDPQQLAVDLQDDSENKDAIIDFASLMNGDNVEQRDDVTEKYIEQMRKLLISDKYFKASSKIRNAIIKFINTSLDSLEIRKEIDSLTASEEQQQPTQPMPQAVQQTIQPAPVQMPGQGVPMTGALPQMQMPQAPPQAPQMPQGMPVQPQMQPAPQVPAGIQGIMQQAQQPLSAPNLNPSRPMPAQGVGSLPPM